MIYDLKDQMESAVAAFIFIQLTRSSPALADKGVVLPNESMLFFCAKVARSSAAKSSLRTSGEYLGLSLGCQWIAVRSLT